MKPVLAQADSCCVLLNPKKLCNTRVAKLHSCLTDPVAHFLLLKSSMNKLFDSREIIFFCTFEPRRQMVDGKCLLKFVENTKKRHAIVIKGRYGLSDWNPEPPVRGFRSYHWAVTVGELVRINLFALLNVNIWEVIFSFRKEWDRLMIM